MLVGFLASLLLAVPSCHTWRDDNGRIARDRHQVTLSGRLTYAPARAS